MIWHREQIRRRQQRWEEVSSMESSALMDQREHLKQIIADMRGNQTVSQNNQSQTPQLNQFVDGQRKCNRCHLLLLQENKGRSGRCNIIMDRVAKSLYEDADGNLDRYIFDSWCISNFITANGSLKSRFITRNIE